ncbi:conserved hypothetical protein [Formosa agariphila KMM 3901]|uniref:Uncharacterized protein n=1 Tax=Formosa agariphila (strain DSM 15362 / KCTC 12365 / LMG 23005 / KMM 3901 / M-2Alg 35-1) TaxID=1347342 RepID=T2KGP5_FORAG|nr:hypothetical protein [Formosa agariphila]CDF77945.1 conserved hypothetical protein [Formosa agariphila KMM 3901]
MSIKYAYLIAFMSLLSFSVKAQVKAKDSTQIYEKIQTYSKERKFTKAIHKLIFRSPNKKNTKKTNTTPNKNHLQFQGQPIRSITIETLDPFGYSVTDTTKTPDKWIDEFGNKAHIKSKVFAIKNLLLFKEKMPLDTLLLNESERLIRSQSFIRSVKIDATKANQASDSVDIKIRVLDSWSFIVKGAISTSKTKVVLNERNFLGFGHEFNNAIEKRYDNNNTGYRFNYVVPNIKNSYVRSELYYNLDIEGFYQKKLNIERTFYSPLTKWAGGIYLDEQFRKDSLPNYQDDFGYEPFKYRTNDIWAGHAFSIFKGKTVTERTTNLITSLRYINVAYKESPSQEYDAINYFSNENFYLGSIAIASRQYVQDRYVFRDGIIEDVPIGLLASVTTGYQRKNKENRYYLGTNFTLAEYFNWGFLSGSIGLESFFNHSKSEQSTINIGVTYFTNLISLGSKWKMRQFIKPQVNLGFDRLNTLADRVSLNDNVEPLGFDRNYYLRNSHTAGIPGFDANLYGTKKMLLAMQTQFYSPWNLWGFRLNPYLNFTAGTIGGHTNPLSSSKIYSSFGVGFIIRNDYLVFSAFQLSLSYYPDIPGQGRNIFKTNSFETDDFGVQAINIGKPSTLLYP